MSMQIVLLILVFEVYSDQFQILNARNQAAILMHSCMVENSQGNVVFHAYVHST